MSKNQQQGYPPHPTPKHNPDDLPHTSEDYPSTVATAIAKDPALFRIFGDIARAVHISSEEQIKHIQACYDIDLKNLNVQIEKLVAENNTLKNELALVRDPTTSEVFRKLQEKYENLRSISKEFSAKQKIEFEQAQKDLGLAQNDLKTTKIQLTDAEAQVESLNTNVTRCRRVFRMLMAYGQFEGSILQTFVGFSQNDDFRALFTKWFEENPLPKHQNDSNDFDQPHQNDDDTSDLAQQFNNAMNDLDHHDNATVNGNDMGDDTTTSNMIPTPTTTISTTTIPTTRNRDLTPFEQEIKAEMSEGQKRLAISLPRAPQSQCLIPFLQQHVLPPSSAKQSLAPPAKPLPAPAARISVVSKPSPAPTSSISPPVLTSPKTQSAATKMPAASVLKDQKNDLSAAEKKKSPPQNESKYPKNTSKLSPADFYSKYRLVNQSTLEYTIILPDFILSHACVECEQLWDDVDEALAHYATKHNSQVFDTDSLIAANTTQLLDVTGSLVQMQGMTMTYTDSAGNPVDLNGKPLNKKPEKKELPSSRPPQRPPPEFSRELLKQYRDAFASAASYIDQYRRFGVANWTDFEDHEQFFKTIDELPPEARVKAKRNANKEAQCRICDNIVPFVPQDGGLCESAKRHANTHRRWYQSSDGFIRFRPTPTESVLTVHLFKPETETIKTLIDLSCFECCSTFSKESDLDLHVRLYHSETGLDGGYGEMLEDLNRSSFACSADNFVDFHNTFKGKYDDVQTDDDGGNYSDPESDDDTPLPSKSKVTTGKKKWLVEHTDDEGSGIDSADFESDYDSDDSDDSDDGKQKRKKKKAVQKDTKKEKQTKPKTEKVTKPRATKKKPAKDESESDNDNENDTRSPAAARFAVAAPVVMSKPPAKRKAPTKPTADDDNNDRSDVEAQNDVKRAKPNVQPIANPVVSIPKAGGSLMRKKQSPPPTE